jgi:Skp family chaperone for outer membrane proteins
MRYYSPEGNIEVWDKKPDGYYTVEEWQELHPAPPMPEPTTNEKIAALDAQYQHDKDQLMQAYLNAMLHADTEQMDALKSDLEALDEQYDTDYEEIISEDEENEDEGE